MPPPPKKHDFKEEYPNIRVGTIESMHNKDILTKSRFFVVRQRLGIRVRYIMTKYFGKELKTIIVVDTLLHSLKSDILHVSIILVFLST